MDQWLLAAQLFSDVPHAPDTRDTLDTRSTRKNQLAKSQSPIPTRGTAFTHAAFRDLPVVGPMVMREMILLDKGDTELEIQKRIQVFLDRGYNMFLLFPEGTFLDSKSLAKSQSFQFPKPRAASKTRKTNKTNILLPDASSSPLTLPEPEQKAEPEKLFTRVLMPRHGAMRAFVQLVQARLKRVIDITLQYPTYDPVRPGNEFQYVHYPSLFAHFASDPKIIPAPVMHIQQYELKGPEDWKVVAKPEWLNQLWAKKNERLERRFDHYHSLKHLAQPKHESATQTVR